MTRIKVLSAAAILSLTFATPVFAQAAIQSRACCVLLSQL
jgi:hypothetical protein